MNTKHRRGFYVLADALRGPGEAYLCTPCIKTHPDYDDIVSVEAINQDAASQKYCQFCECKLLASK